MQAIARHGDLHAVAASLTALPDAPLDAAALGVCVPRPQKIFGIGLNYRSHAAESGMEIPQKPVVFTKFPSCLTGPTGDVVLYGPTTDWEAELVVVIGTRARDIAAADAWKAIAGLHLRPGHLRAHDAVRRQAAALRPRQVVRHLRPIGPAVVSLDQLADPDDLAITCDVNGERRQDARTSDLIFDVPELIAYLSAVCTLEPGDLIFTGTPAGVGSISGTFLKPGDTITTTIEGLGTLTNRCVATGSLRCSTSPSSAPARSAPSLRTSAASTASRPSPSTARPTSTTCRAPPGCTTTCSASCTTPACSTPCCRPRA